MTALHPLRSPVSLPLRDALALFGRPAPQDRPALHRGRTVAGGLALLGGLALFLVAFARPTPLSAQGIEVEDMKSALFQIEALRADRESSGRPYLPFLNVPTLRVGLYELAAGAEDGQQPHEDDEVYYIISGRARISIGGEPQDVSAGDIVFVGAHVEHHFFDIEEDLSVLVFFSEAEVP